MPAKKCVKYCIHASYDMKKVPSFAFTSTTSSVAISSTFISPLLLILRKNRLLAFPPTLRLRILKNCSMMS